MMIKPPDFWNKVASDVFIAAHAMNEQVPLWEEMDDLAQKSMVLVCQLAIRQAMKHGKALLPAEVIDDPKPAA